MVSQRIQKIKKLFKRGLSVKKVLKGREGHNVSKTGQKGSNRSRRVQKSPKCPKGHRVSKIVQKGPNYRKGSYRGSLIHKGNEKSAKLNNFDTFHTRILQGRLAYAWQYADARARLLLANLKWTMAEHQRDRKIERKDRLTETHSTGGHRYEREIDLSILGLFFGCFLNFWFWWP